MEIDSHERNGGREGKEEVKVVLRVIIFLLKKTVRT